MIDTFKSWTKKLSVEENLRLLRQFIIFQLIAYICINYGRIIYRANYFLTNIMYSFEFLSTRWKFLSISLVQTILRLYIYIYIYLTNSINLHTLWPNYIYGNLFIYFFWKNYVFISIFKYKVKILLYKSGTKNFNNESYDLIQKQHW